MTSLSVDSRRSFFSEGRECALSTGKLTIVGLHRNSVVRILTVSARGYLFIDLKY